MLWKYRPPWLWVGPTEQLPSPGLKVRTIVAIAFFQIVRQIKEMPRFVSFLFTLQRSFANTNIDSPMPHSPHRDTASSAAAPAAAITPADGYAGDISPVQAYAWLTTGQLVVVDVRSDAEREWVGYVPGAIAIAWKQWPGMVPNANFDSALQTSVAPGGKVAFLCRSGVRSIAAARRATELGLQAYNILDGFEGNLDADAHRNTTGGWRKAGLPWRQN